MKKIVALLLALAMVTVMLVGCSNSDSNSSSSQPQNTTDDQDFTADQDSTANETKIPLDGSWPEETVKIGVVTYDTTEEVFMEVMDYFDYLSKYYNVEFIVSEPIGTAENEFAFIDSCASAGCQGIFAYYNAAGAQSIKQATAQGMYYWGMEQYYEEVKDDPYYLGSKTFLDASDADAKSGEYLAGYELGLAMGNAGLEHVAFCNGGAAHGIQMFVDRQAGFLDGFAEAQANGSTTRFDPETDIIEGFPGSTAFTAAQAAFFAEDYDGVCTSFDASSWFQPIIDSGKDIKVGTPGSVSDTYKAFVDNGTVVALVYYCSEYMWGSGFVSLVNAATGHVELTRVDDAPLLNHVQTWVLSDANDYNAVYDKHINNGEYFVSAEDIANVLGAINPNTTTEDVAALFDASLADAMQ